MALLNHYYAIYTDGNGAGASIANIIAGTGTGYLTGGSSLDVTSGVQVTFDPTGLPPASSVDLEYVVENDTTLVTTRAATVNFDTLLFEDLTQGSLTVASQSIFVDKTFLVTQSTLTVTGQTVTLDIVPTSSEVTFTLNDRLTGTPLLSETGIEYAIWAAGTLDTLGAPALQGTTATDGSGIITITTTGTFLVNDEIIIALRKPAGGAGGSDDDWGLGAETATAP